MKRLVAIVLVGILSTPGCALRLASKGPRIVHGPSMWGNVVSLPPNAQVRVFTPVTWLEGAFIAADDAELRIRTTHGDVLLPADHVLRVDRLLRATGSRGQRALVGAAVGAAMSFATSVLTMAFLCTVFGGHPCWAPPPPRAVATTAAIYAGAAVISDDSRPLTIYLRP
jgi:hypothetical protein